MTDQDHDLYGRVRAGFEPVRMGAGLDAVAARGGVLRRRRRVAVPAVACLVVAALVAALTLPVTGSPVPPGIELAAWTVEPEPDGTITLTVRELFDPQGLEARLKQAGVRSRVVFLPAGSAGCAEQRDGLPALYDVMNSRPVEGGGVFHLRPSAMPPGSTLQFVAVAASGGRVESLRMGLFDGEPPQC